MTEGNVAYENKNVSPEALASLGEGQLAYVKQIRSEDVPGLFPQAASRARPETVRAAYRERPADHADGLARSRAGQRMEQRIAGRQRSLNTGRGRDFAIR